MIDEFDLDTYLDNAGVPISKETPTTHVIWNSVTRKMVFADDELRQPEELLEWRNKTIYGTGAILKNKEMFPLCFVESPDGSIWTDPDNFNTKVFMLQPGHQLTVVEEGALKVGKITPQDIPFEGQLGAGAGKSDWSHQPVIYEDQAMYELRYLKCLTLFDHDSWAADFQGAGITHRKILGPTVFFLLFDRATGKKYADEVLFETLWDSGNSGELFDVIDYRDFLTIL